MPIRALCELREPPMTCAYDFTATDIDGRERSLREFAGRALLLVNVASKCGFTPQYRGLEALWRKHRDAGFAVLGFPCDQFGHQEPGDEAEIKAFCSLELRRDVPAVREDRRQRRRGASPVCLAQGREGGIFGTEAIKWNFTKFLVDRCRPSRAALCAARFSREDR